MRGGVRLRVMKGERVAVHFCCEDLKHRCMYVESHIAFQKRASFIQKHFFKLVTGDLNDLEY